MADWGKKKPPRGKVRAFSPEDTPPDKPVNGATEPVVSAAHCGLARSRQSKVPGFILLGSCTIVYAKKGKGQDAHAAGHILISGDPCYK